MGFMETIFGPPCTRCGRRTRKSVAGAPVCQTCQTQEAARQEAIMTCPKCGAAMTKEIQQTVVYDKCSGCGGVWLDKHELEALAAIASATGQATGQASGMILGMAMAPHHHS